MVELEVEQRRTVLGDLVYRDSDEGILDGDVLGSGELLLDFYQLVLPHHQHVAEIADSSGTSAAMVDLHVVQGLSSFL